MMIIETYPGKENFYLFSDVMKQLYNTDSLRYKQADYINEEYLKKCFVLLNKEIPCGRISVYKNPYLKHKEFNVFCLGNYECTDDMASSNMLLNTSINHIKSEGGNFIIGPMNGSTWESYRFSMHHNAPNFFLEPYNHLYYNQQFNEFGFEELARYFSSHTYNLDFENEHVNKLYYKFMQNGVNIRNINLSNFKNELQKLYPFLLDAFKTNFMYTPITFKNFSKKYKELKKFINPEFALIAEDKNQNIVGVFFCIHDYYNTTSKTLIIKTIARNPDKQWSGLGHVMGSIIYKRASENAYTEIIHAFMYQQGTSTGVSEKFMGTPFKNYILYGKEI